jgi:hypothetical protein
MSMLIAIPIALAILFISLMTIAALQPADFRIARSVAIAAPPAAAFGPVNDLRRWEAWSPFEKHDPQMQRNYGEISTGAGATFSWSGNRRAGAGRVTILESRPSDLIRIKLEMFRPFAAINAVEFTFRPEGAQTVATWSMTGKNALMAKAVGLIMNMDKMVGGEFEQGLASLKKLAEAPAGN